jgi:predicted nuclease with TOPRIM domain
LHKLNEIRYSYFSMDKQKIEEKDNQQKSLSIVELDSLIKRYLKDIGKLKEDIKEQNGMFNDAFNNDVKYKETADKQKEMNKVKNAVKQVLMKDPSIVATSEKVKELKDEMKDLQDALTGYVSEYQRLSGATSFEDDDGNLLQIVHTVRLVKKSAF